MTRWIVAAGAFVVSLDSTVNIAFPAIAAAFDAPPEAMRWVVVCYVFTYAVTSFAGGAVADRAGHASVFRAGLALSVLGFLLSGMAPTLAWLLAGRVLQGLASGLVYGTAPGLLTLAATEATRGRALGFLNGAIGLAFALGPLVAGALVAAFGWRAVFHIRVPLALAALGWAMAALPGGRPGGAHRSVTVADLTRGTVLGASALSFVANAAIFAVWLLAPFYLVSARGLGTIVGGVLFMLTPLGTAVAAPLAGRAADRLGPRLPVATGLAVEAAGLLLMSRAGDATSLAVLALALFAAGFGLGLFQVPNMASVMAAFPAGQQGVAGGLTFLSRTLGIVTGVLVLAEVFAVRRAAAGFEAAFGEAFLLAALAVVVGAAVAGARPWWPRARPAAR